MKTPKEIYEQTTNYSITYTLKKAFKYGYIIGRFAEQLNAFAKAYPEEKIVFDYGEVTFVSTNRQALVAFLQIFGGKWSREVDNCVPTQIKYEQLLETSFGDCISITACGTPPPSCRIVEEEVEVPAQPARKEKRTKMVCGTADDDDTNINDEKAEE